jgi:hypothetical protein
VVIGGNPELAVLEPRDQGERYPSSREHLLAELARVEALVVARLAETHARRAGADTDAPATAEPRHAALAREIGERLAATRAAGVPLRLDRLSIVFGLDRFDVDTLLLALLPELVAAAARDYAFLQDDPGRPRLSVDLLLSLMCGSFRERLEARAHLAADAPLVRHALVHVLHERPDLQPPQLAHYLKVDERIVAYLLDDSDTIDARLADFVHLVEPRRGLSELGLPLETATRLRAWATHRLGANRQHVLHLLGPAGVGKKTTAASLCRAVGRPMLVVGVRALAAAPPERCAFLFRLAQREALLHDALVCWDGFDALLADTHAAERATFVRALAEAGAPAFVTGEARWEPTGELRDLAWASLELAAPGTAAQTRLWHAALGEARATVDVDVGVLVSRHPLTAGQIQDALASARRRAELRTPDAGRVSMPDLLQACAQHAQPRLGALARRIESADGWDDLVLRDDRKQRLRELCHHARYRDHVLEQWGFGDKLSTGKGLSALFAGPPGTGKTMAASVLASELGLPLYQIDLSAVVSKYIGETEKQLAELFREAERTRAILFFDEADALFGKRTEVHDSHDRYANLETSYLLQRMDSYEGVVILASNWSHNIDNAFVRRLRFIVDFALPDELERLAIWQRVWPAGLPRDASVDLPELARRFELAGGPIRNIVLAAAFLAAPDGGAVTQRHILHASRREFQKIGKIVDDSLFA